MFSANIWRFRITSAHTESTVSYTVAWPFGRDYLCAYREYRLQISATNRAQGLPLRIQRVLVLKLGHINIIRITSAHTESTAGAHGWRHRSQDYLCAYREYFLSSKLWLNQWGLPLRIQRVPERSSRTDWWSGITSAHTESTNFGSRWYSRSRDYLCAYREYSKLILV